MANITLTTTREGLVNDLEYAVNKIDNNNLSCFLFINDATIIEDMTLADVTKSVESSGFALDGANWSVVYTTKGEATYSTELSFSFTGSETVYGAYLTNQAQTRLIAIGKFGASRSVELGDSIKISSINRNTDNV
jgi:hypothetical protein